RAAPAPWPLLGCRAARAIRRAPTAWNAGEAPPRRGDAHVDTRFTRVDAVRNKGVTWASRIV
ncbi:hypothetical protein BE20_33020, partial [Sorangium cellulosum]